MVRAYGRLKCHMCHKIPSLGWVYACQQDRLTSQVRLGGDVLGMAEDFVAVEDGDDYFEAQV